MNSTSSTILATISSLFKSLFSSIDESIYSALDKIAFIDTDIMKSSYFEKILGTSANNGILLIANALLVGFIIYFAAKHLLSSFGIVEASNPAKFILKLIIIGICMNCSFFICGQILNINSLISSAIREIGKNLLHFDITFSKLVDISNTIISIEENSTKVFTIDGILKTITSFGFLNLIFLYAVRYVLIKVFILISPFAFLTLGTKETSHIFKSWFKCFISLLFTEIFAALILIVMFSVDYSMNNLVSKLLFIGAILALMKVNNYVRDFIGGISIDTFNNMYGLRNMMKLK